MMTISNTAVGEVASLLQGKEALSKAAYKRCAACSGPKMYDIPEGKFDRYAKEGYVADHQVEDTQFFQVISIDGNTLTYQAFAATGELYDEAVITKNAETGRKQFE